LPYLDAYGKKDPVERQRRKDHWRSTSEQADDAGIPRPLEDELRLISPQPAVFSSWFVAEAS